MGERAQFIWGSLSVLLWLLTFLFVVGYNRVASDFFVPYVIRRPPSGLGYAYWQANFSSDMDLRAGLEAAGCVTEASAPLCHCLNQTLEVTVTSACPRPYDPCFFLQRPVQYADVQSQGVRAYVQLLCLNLYAALVGATVLVRDKLENRHSYAVQALIMGLVFVLTLGALWMSLSATLGEWLSFLLVGLVLVMLVRLAPDTHAFIPFQWQVLLSAALPVLWLIFAVYNHRTDAIRVTTTSMLALALALLSWVRMQLESLSLDCWEAVRALGVVGWCNALVAVVGGSLIALSYDSIAVNVLDSATYAWCVACLYTSLALHPLRFAGQTLFVELLLRAILSVAMLKELFV